MRHKLDIHPIPEEMLYVNDPSLAVKVPYETEDEMEKAVTGKKKSEGGILPDDNVRIYVPMDLNVDGIMRQLYALYGALGEPTESNELVYYSGVRKIITQLEIYDQVWVARKVEESVQKENGGVRHSRNGIELAGEIINYLEKTKGLPSAFLMMRLRSLEMHSGFEWIFVKLRLLHRNRYKINI